MQLLIVLALSSFLITLSCNLIFHSMSITTIVNALYQQEQTQHILTGALNYAVARYTSEELLHKQLLDKQKIIISAPDITASSHKIFIELTQQTPDTIVIQAQQNSIITSCILYKEKIEKKEEAIIVYTIEYR